MTSPERETKILESGSPPAFEDKLDMSVEVRLLRLAASFFGPFIPFAGPIIGVLGGIYLISKVALQFTIMIFRALTKFSMKILTEILRKISAIRQRNVKYKRD